MSQPLFQIEAPYQPTGDQPRAIAELTAGLKADERYQTLLGATGTGKTFVMGNIIQAMNRPALVMAHNKTLAAQLYNEFKRFFPNNAVRYFVSYYDYYQPEAYVPTSDLYIEKDAQINEEIDRLRHATTEALLTRRDVIVVASVSCIYGLGSPERYKAQAVLLQQGGKWSRHALLKQLTDSQYQRNDTELRRGTFSVKGDSIEIFPAYDDATIRLNFFGDELEAIERRDPFHSKKLSDETKIWLYPAKHYVAPSDDFPAILGNIRTDMNQEVAAFQREGKILEAERLRTRTEQDLEMLEVTGTVAGIENYSRYFDERAPGTPPSTLLNFFPKDFLLFIDESHMTVPQIRGMHNGDRARKDQLINYGFRLKAAYDNRPLRYPEFLARTGQTIYVSATPSDEEKERSSRIAEQIIRPTGLVDPVIEVRPTEHQIDDVLAEVQGRIKHQQRVLVTTLTKRMSEELADYLHDLGIKVAYLHSDVETLERSEILRDLRLGVYDVIVGINLLREGLDLPEVSRVLILDADKEGFLRSSTSLIQTIGRAARHLEGKVIMYADRITGSMQVAIEETERRRGIQEAYNREHNIVPQTISRDIEAQMQLDLPETETVHPGDTIPAEEKKQLVKDLTEKMELAAANLEFEKAAMLRDQLALLAGENPETESGHQKRGPRSKHYRH